MNVKPVISVVIADQIFFLKRFQLNVPDYYPGINCVPVQGQTVVLPNYIWFQMYDTLSSHTQHAPDVHKLYFIRILLTMWTFITYFIYILSVENLSEPRLHFLHYHLHKHTANTNTKSDKETPISIKVFRTFANHLNRVSEGRSVHGHSRRQSILLKV